MINSRRVPSLREYIDSYQFIEAPAPESSVDSYGTMFPLGYPMIEFNLSSGWVKRPTVSTETETIGSNITSFTNKPFRIQPTGQVKSAVARFHPLAVRKIFGDDIRRNTLFDPHLVFGRHFAEAEEKVALARNTFEMKEHMDEFFISVFRASQIEIDRRVDYLLKRIIVDGGATNVLTVAKEMGISSKRIEQLFVNHIGMAPKAYAGIVRFQKVIAAYQPGIRLTDLAFEAGYYDQSHFIRHFKKITNQTPKEFFQNECLYTAKVTNLYNFSQ